MNLKQLIVLAFLCLGLGAYVYYGIQKPAERKAATAEFESRIIQEDLSLLNFLKVQNPQGEFVLEKTEDHWRLTQPKDEVDIASSAKIRSLITSLEGLNIKKTILEGDDFSERKESLGQYGIDDSALKLIYKTAAMDESKEVWIGVKNPDSTGTYARALDQDKLQLLDDGLDMLKRAKAKDYREMKLTTVEARDYAEVELENQYGTFKFIRDKDGLWTMSKPQDLPIDESKVKNFINKVALIRANDFLANTEAPKTKRDQIKLVVGFKEDVKDLRTDAGDQRPQGTELILSRAKKKGRKASKPDDFEYFADSDKAGWAKIARFHYDNFNKDYRDFVIKKFDQYESDQLASIELLKRGAVQWRIGVSENPSIQNLSDQKDKKDKKDKNEALSDKAYNQLLSHIRGWKADKFVAVEPAPKPSQVDFSLILELQDGSQKRFDWKKQKNAWWMWTKVNEKPLKYSFKKSGFKENLFTYKSLMPEEKEGKEQVADKEGGSSGEPKNR